MNLRCCSWTSPTRASTGRPTWLSGTWLRTWRPPGPRPWSSATWSSSTTVSTGSATSPTAGSGRRPAMRQQLETAIRLTLAAQVRNRLAWVLLVAFVPVWYLLIGSMISHAGTVFRLRATGAGIVVDGHDLTLVTAGLSAITLITGFVVFAAVRRSLPFDRRLVLSGYRHAALIAAKTSAALSQAVGIGAYAALVMLVFWRPP